MKKILALLVISVSFINVNAQLPLGSATLDITLQCSGGTANRSCVAYNPNQQLYYSVNAGSASYPIETFDLSGTQVSTTTAGFDYRGAWWNPNTNALEGNGFNTLGIWIQNLDGSFFPLNTGTNDIPGVGGPNSQSCGDYDYVDDEVIYYSAGTIYSYTRSTHTLITSVAVTGLPVSAANLNSNTIVFTGVAGMEIGLYDYINKAFYFVDKITGAYATLCQLPVGAPAASTFKMGFGNGRLWLYDGTTAEWKGYQTVSTCSNTTSAQTVSTCYSYTSPSGNYTYTATGNYTDTIPNVGGCDSIISLDVTINNSTASSITLSECASYTSPSGNYTYTSSGVYYDTIPNLMGCDSIITIDVTINNVDTTVLLSDPITLSANQSGGTYQWIDCSTGNPISGETNQSFTATSNGDYAVIIGANGCTDTSDCYSITNVAIEEAIFQRKISYYPNPTQGNIYIDLGGNQTEILIEVHSVSGQLISSETFYDVSQLNYVIDGDPGVYFIRLTTGSELEAVFRITKE